MITLVARISASSRTLELDFSYLGGLTLNEEVIINEIHLALDTEIYVIPVDPIKVTGPKRVTISIPKAGSQLQLSKE